jgi:deoxyribonuclease II
MRICLIVLAIIAFHEAFSFELSDLIDESSAEWTASFDRQQRRLSCRNEITGEPLDWYTVYKLPKLDQKLVDDEHDSDEEELNEKATNPFILKGTSYAYMNNQQPQWTLSDLSINDTLSMPAKTLELLYTTDFNDSQTDIGYILYNDQADKITLVRGHTKGVLLFDNESVVWLVHSVPHFPAKAAAKSYAIQPSQCVYGQSMLCMSFDIAALDTIAEQLMYSFPQVYDFALPAKLRAALPTVIGKLTRIINDAAHVQQPPWYSVKQLQTIGGERMLSVVKYTNFEDDLYAGLLADQLASSLFTETWNNGPGTLPSNCTMNSPYHVYNIQQIKFENIGVKFSVHHDHSKWAVTSSNERSIIWQSLSFDKRRHGEVQVACVGDINRQEEQLKRGGGTVCFMNNSAVWQQYSRLVDAVQQCKKVRVSRIKIKKIKPNADSNEKLIILG